MKVAITASEKDFNAHIDERFGRCRYFVFVDTDSMDIEAIENSAALLSSGSGAPAAYIVLNHAAEAVLTGRIGPTAADILSHSGIPVYTGIDGSVQDALQRFNEHSLTKVEGPTVHSGSGRNDRPNKMRRIQ